MGKNGSILFTSIGRRVELVQAFRKAAEELEYGLSIYGADVLKSAPALFFCDRHVEICRASENEYIPQLLDICERESIEALIPTIDTDLLLLARHKKDFEKVGTKVFISETSKIEICRDKRRTGDFFQSCGLKSPITVDNIRKYNYGFPAFIKPLDGSSSVDAYMVNEQQALEAYGTKIKDYIIQPYIEGIEYTVDVFCDYEGNPVYITPRERMAIRSGEVLKTRICQNMIIIEEIKKIIAIFKPCGPITVQLIQKEDTKENYYIEINPRFGGGAPLSIKAGANSAEALLKILIGERVDYIPCAARDGAIYSRFDQSICIDEGVQKNEPDSRD